MSTAIGLMAVVLKICEEHGLKRIQTSLDQGTGKALPEYAIALIPKLANFICEGIHYLFLESHFVILKANGTEKIP